MWVQAAYLANEGAIIRAEILLLETFSVSNEE
jgi:hypothetical protein